MAISKLLILTDPMGHDMPCNYHVVVNINNDRLHNKTTVTIASYNAKGQYEWKKESFVKPPRVYTFEGGDLDLTALQDLIIDLPEWKDAVVVE